MTLARHRPGGAATKRKRSVAASAAPARRAAPCSASSFASPWDGGIGCTLFSVQPIPPSQGDAKLDALHGAAGRAGATLAATLLFLFVAAPPGRWRASVMLAAAWCLLRAPLGPSLPRASLFSPAVFYRSMLGVFSASAGSL